MLRLDWNLLWNIINLIILYLLMRHFLIGPVIAIMDKRRADIEGRYEQAGRAEQEAAARKVKYEEKLKAASEESEMILEQSRQAARLEYDKILEEAGRKSARTLEETKAAMEVEREKLLLETRKDMVSLVMAVTGKVIGEQNRDGIDEHLYTEFLEKAGDGHDAAVN